MKSSNVKTTYCYFSSPVPLPVLIQAADDLVSLFDDGDQLIHEQLLSIPILLTPVALWMSRRMSKYYFILHQLLLLNYFF